MIHVGDCRDVLRTMAAGSVHCCVTSPPYWGLRDYGVDGQLGLERTPEEYVANILSVFREVRRVLRDDGTVWLNLGDSYAAARGGTARPAESLAGGVGGQDLGNTDSLRGRKNGYQAHRDPKAHGLKHKDMVGIPWRVALALQADGWWLRSDIIWAKPNPMPESVTDRPTRSHEYVFLLTKAEQYYYDAAAISEPAVYAGEARWNPGTNGLGGEDCNTGRSTRRFKQDGHGRRHEGFNARYFDGEPAAATRTSRTVWNIATQPYKEAHFATFPVALAERCILAGTSAKGCCAECGAPWERQIDVEYVKSPAHGAGSVVGRHYETGANGWDGAGLPRVNKQTTTTGWQPTCDHDAPFVPCTVLDPFAGAGTTGVAGLRNRRKFVGVELNQKYVRMARRRLNDVPLSLDLVGGSC